MKISVEKLTQGGDGLARSSGKVIFVRDGVPGDEALVKVYKETKGFMRASIAELVEPSPHRTEPRCPVYTWCGGCQWQHIDYEYQKQAKESILRETLERLGGITDPEIGPITGPESPYGYRSKVSLTLWAAGRKHFIGYHEKGSSRLVSIGGCPIAETPVEEAIATISRVLSSIKSSPLRLERAAIATDGERAYITLYPERHTDRRPLTRLVEHLKRFPETEFISIIPKEVEFTITACGMRYILTPSLFSQACSSVNEAMLATAAEWARDLAPASVLELYSGAGNFTLPLAAAATRLTAVEIDPGSSRYAGRSAAENGIDNCEFITASAEDYLSGPPADTPGFDLVVLDPPREGAKDVLDGIAALSPGAIIYISCDPAILARDLSRLARSGYEPRDIRPFDMFPNTFHIETMVLLRKV